MASAAFWLSPVVQEALHVCLHLVNGRAACAAGDLISALQAVERAGPEGPGCRGVLEEAQLRTAFVGALQAKVSSQILSDVSNSSAAALADALCAALSDRFAAAKAASEPLAASLEASLQPGCLPRLSDVTALLSAPASADTPEESLCKIDMRCGRILEVSKVPDSEKLYLLKVDIGDPTHRQVCTGLQKHFALEDLQGRLVVMYCNIKTGKMAGFESQAMVLCATCGKGTETELIDILSVPEGTKPGTAVKCGEYEVGCLAASQNVNKISKVWSSVMPLLRTNEDLKARKKTHIWRREKEVQTKLDSWPIFGDSLWRCVVAFFLSRSFPSLHKAAGRKNVR